MPPKGKAELAHPEAADWVLGTLGPEQAEDFQRHLTSCLHCQAAVAGFGQLGQMLQHLPPAVEPPEDLETRTIAGVMVKAAFEQAATQVHQVPMASSRAAEPESPQAARIPLSPPEPKPDERPGAGRAKIIRFPRTGLLAIAGAVAAAIIAALVILPGLGHGGLGQAVTFKLSSLRGQAASGAATARPVASGSWNITLTVKHLRVPPRKSWYECWYEGGGQVVSAGTFVVEADGSGTFSMTSAADPHQFPTMVITLESPSNNGAFQGEVVLTSQKT